MYKEQKVSVIMPCYNEGKNVKNCINQFFNTGVVDDIVVVDNNSRDESQKKIQETKAKYVLETAQGYGAALIRGLQEAEGDILIMVEPDGTFRADDIHKLLSRSDFGYDIVFGTRTKTYDKKAKMGPFLLIGNTVLAKILQILRHGCKITDVGCTYRLIKRNAYEIIKEDLTVKGSHFSPEFMMRCFQNKLRCTEIPVKYCARIGESKITSTTRKSIRVGINMLKLIIKG